MRKEEWLFDITKVSITKGFIELPQAIERLFIEILSNASDNAHRSRRTGINPDKIEVTMNERVITIKNYGIPIPIEIHPIEKIYVPEMIFGSMLTGSNYEGDRHEAGRNGLGAKLVNIFSKKFYLEVGNAISHLSYVQSWNENMINRTDPIISRYDLQTSYVFISYELDFARFKYDKYPLEAFQLFARHCCDISFTAKIPVIFNGTTINLCDIREYARLYFGDVSMSNSIIHYEWPEGCKIISKKGGVQVCEDSSITPIIEMCVIDTPWAGESISFVNSMMTRDGGVHVDAALKAVSTMVIDTINSNSESNKGKSKDKKKGSKVIGKTKEKESKPKIAPTIRITDVKPHISLILASKLVNPKFSSQSKTHLTTPVPKFVIEENELKPMLKWELMKRLLAELEAKQFGALMKTDGKKKRHIILDNGVDCNEAGGPNSYKCILYIIEGKSAKGYANKLVSHSPDGRDYMGILPIRGKLINAMNASVLKVSNNKEVEELKSMLGLREGLDYRLPENFKTLRYGRVCVMADADDDGIHIRGLVTLYFHCYGKSLLQRNDFIFYYDSPIIRVTHGKQVRKFFTQGEYNAWKRNTPNSDKWEPEYFKGLGTSTDNDIKEDYNDPHYRLCIFDEKADEKMKLAFDNKLTDERKLWIASWKPLDDVTYIPSVTLTKFIDNELIQFSASNLKRSIPSIMDGLKPGQRKILWTAWLHWKWEEGKDSSYKKFKVSQLANKVSDKMKYHHGEDSLSDAITKMAQDFVGSNNMPFFTREGQLGSREEGGNDAADPRYPYVKPEWWLPYVFKRNDMPLLEMTVTEGHITEPVFMLPIIPLQIINGCRGIGTGHSTFMPNHNPLDVIAWYKAKIRKESLPYVTPWYRGFTGETKIVDRKRRKNHNDDPDDICGVDEAITEEELEEEENDKSHFLSLQTRGTFHFNQDMSVTVTELPIGRWNHTYRLWLDNLLHNKKIIDYVNRCTPEKPLFTIWGFQEANIRTLKLQKSYGMSNMVLFNKDNLPTDYEYVEDVLESFYMSRLPYYEKRKANILNELNEIIRKDSLKIRFIKAVRDNVIVLRNSKFDVNYPLMDNLGLPRELLDKTKAGSFSEEEIARLLKEQTEAETKYREINAILPQNMWYEDLEIFEKAYRNKYKVKLTIKNKSVSISLNAKRTEPPATLLKVMMVK